MIDDVHTPAMDLPVARKQTVRRRLVRWPSTRLASVRWPVFRWPSIRRPSLSSAVKASASVAIIAATAGIVLMRAPEISRANVPNIPQTKAPENSPQAQAVVTPSPAAQPLPTTPPAAPTAPTATAAANSECSNQVWPFIAAGCLQGQTQPDTARMAVATSQPDLQQKQLQNADEQSREAARLEQLSRAEPDQPSRRETREERRARRYEERRARYEEQRAQYEARYEERRARYEERRVRRYDFGF